MRFIKFFVLFASVAFSALAFAGPVNINTADAKALAAAAKGIGQKKAEAIVHYRKAHGPFAKLQDLKKVKGIGPRTLQENKSNLTVGAE